MILWVENKSYFQLFSKYVLTCCNIFLWLKLLFQQGSLLYSVNYFSGQRKVLGFPKRRKAISQKRDVAGKDIRGNRLRLGK